MTDQTPPAASGGATGVPRGALDNHEALEFLLWEPTPAQIVASCLFAAAHFSGAAKDRDQWTPRQIRLFARDAATWGRRALAAGAPRPWRKKG